VLVIVGFPAFRGSTVAPALRTHLSQSSCRTPLSQHGHPPDNPRHPLVAPTGPYRRGNFPPARACRPRGHLHNGKASVGPPEWLARAATMKPPAEVAPRIFSSLPHRGVLRRKRRLPQRPCRSLRDRAVEEGRVLLQILQYRLPPAICCIGPHLSRESPSQPMMPLRLNPSHRLWHHSPSQSQPPFRSGMLFRNAGRGPPPNLSCGRSKHNCACGRIGHRACREASPRRHSSGILATSSRPCGKAHDRQQGVREFWTLWCKEHVQSFSF
jgi:hypothetical protein